MSIAAYNPRLWLRESYVDIYKIYILKHPDTGDVFYVGQTNQDLGKRLYGHLHDGVNEDKTDYIQSLIKEGKEPIIESVEVIQTTCYIDKYAVNEREIYWIKFFKEKGCLLTNKASTSPNSKSAEYHNYLASLKRGQAEYHYYYCGETASGIRVYDEQKLIADGFGLPESKIFKTYQDGCNDSRYSPWDNPRFTKWVGKTSPYDTTQYVDCYRDTDPNYYDDDY